MQPGKPVIVIKDLIKHYPEVKAVNAIKMELECFRNAILQNTDTPVNIIDGYRALEVAHLILEKIQNRQG